MVNLAVREFVFPTLMHEVRVISNAAFLGGLCVERSRNRADLGLRRRCPQTPERCLGRSRAGGA
jgi:hypothetical protein